MNAPEHNNDQSSKRPQRHYDDVPLDLEPDDEDDERAKLIFRPGNLWKNSKPPGANEDTKHDSSAEAISSGGAPVPPASVGEALRWAIDSMQQPAMAAADWLALDIDPAQPTAVALLTNPKITLTQVRQAKTVFKTMRIVGEKSADRRIGARMYAAAIAAALVFHGKRISAQSDRALKKGFQGLLDDRRMPMPLRDLAGKALCVLTDLKRGSLDEPGTHSKSA
jgi:hypothetical protein